MPRANRPNRKAEDADIIRLNSLGLSLRTIGQALGIHPTSVNQRLQALGVPSADTRRCFMESIVLSLTDEQALWLSQQLGPTVNLKTLVHKLIVEEFIRNKKGQL